MKQWLKYLFATYFRALGAAVFFTALLIIAFSLNTITAFFLVVIGSSGIFIANVLLDLEDGKIDYIFAGAE